MKSSSGKKSLKRNPKKRLPPRLRENPAASAPKQSASDVRKENKSGLAGGAVYFLFVISVSIILACLAWAAATDVLGFKSSDTVAQITLDKDSFTYKEVEVKDDDGNTKTKKVHYADMPISLRITALLNTSGCSSFSARCITLMRR